MQTQNQTETPATIRENVFGDDGETLETREIPVGETGEDVIDEVPAAPAHKYRIGDQTFATQEEALAFANQAVELETQRADAYRQGLLDGNISSANPGSGVTPPAAPAVPELNTEELYTNPQAFLDKFANKIKSETRNELSAADQMKAQSDQIWREFTDRHPALAEFRSEVEQFVQADTANVRAIINTKGRPASYDYIATKLKSRFESYATALKPKRALPNNAGGASPTQSAASGVTPKETAKKALSFSEQIRSIRKRR